MDRLVGYTCLFIGGAFLGLILAEEKAAVALQPCPKQTGYHQTTSTWTKAEGLRCYYTPIIKKV